MLCIISQFKKQFLAKLLIMWFVYWLVWWGSLEDVKTGSQWILVNFTLASGDNPDVVKPK